MTTARKRSLILAAGLGIGVAGALLIPRGHGATRASHDEAPAAQVTSTDSLRAEIIGLPAIIYAGEGLNYLVHVENVAAEVRAIRVVHADPWGRQEQSVTLAPAGAMDVPFALRAARRVSAASASVSICSADDPQRPLWREGFEFRDGRSDLSGIVATGRGYTNERGEPVVLVNYYEDEAKYRRWAPVKWAVRECRRPRAPVIVSAPDGFRPDVGVLPEEWQFLPYAGDPLSAALNLPSEVPADGPAVVCLAWGFDEAVNGVPVRDFARALDLAIDRLRRHNSAVQVALVTPPPSPTTAETSGRYAEAVRALAREHHAQLVDLAAKSREDEHWERMYALDDDTNLAGLYPKPEGLREWGEWLERGIDHRESFVTGKDERAHIAAGSTTAEAVPNASPEMLHARFPGIATISRPTTFSRAPNAVFAGVFVPSDAPRALQLSLFVKDKDGLWFQSAPVSRLPSGQWQTVRFDLDPCDNLLSGRGHDGAWNAYYAGHIMDMGLQFFAPTKWEGAIQIGDLRAADEAPARSIPLRIVNFQRLTATPAAYETTEFSFDLSVPVANPFDPDDTDVQAVFISPSGKTFTRPAFYYQGYCRSMGDDQIERVGPSGRASWRVRYVPLEAGRHTWILRAKVGAKEVETRPQSFMVAAHGPHGFPRVSPADPRYFETADGKFFYPIGLNIHAPFDTRCAQMLGTPVLPNRGTYAYDYYLEKMGRNRMNAMIMWMSNWWLSIEWTDRWKGFGGLVDYNLGNAWRLDHVLDAAAKNGVYINLVLDNHGKYSGYVDSEWPTNPYNSANGGPCETPEAFFTSDEAFNIYAKRLRYIIARWGHHPNLLGLEIVSELNLVGTTKKFEMDPSHVAWVQGVGAYLDAIDAYHRPITIQYSNNWRTMDGKVAQLPEVDYIVGDAYKKSGSIAPLMIRTAAANTQYGKPTFSAEFGGSWIGTTPSRLHADLHCGLWTNAMTQSAGAPFFWWFDFVDRYNLYPEFGVLRDFMEDEKRIGKGSRTVEEIVVSGKEDGAEAEESAGMSGTLGASDSPRSRKLKGVALCGKDRASFYVYNDLYSEMMPDTRYAGWHRGATLRVPMAVAPGRQPQVEIWNTFDGTRQALSPERIAVETGEIVIRLPDFQIDLVGKLALDPALAPSRPNRIEGRHE
jgi:hypothetical protein